MIVKLVIHLDILEIQFALFGFRGLKGDKYDTKPQGLSGSGGCGDFVTVLVLDEGQKTTGNLNMNSKRLLNLGAHKIVYDTNNPHIVTNVKNQLEYSDGFSRSVAKTVFGIQALMAQQPTPIQVLKLENY